ncbi:MAG: hypothetical protein B6241_08325 [Spirochaetaceae bacterium 4572_59]|nr:MAG: hypothetical protein B6241_08325 [Spirochaetaceae bacterium 4572_59]
MKLLTPAEMRELDKSAIENLGIPESVLMENAASAALSVLSIQFKAEERKGLILCGTGNNGGDGLALARKIHSLNWDVEVLLFGSVEKLSPPSKNNYNTLKRISLTLHENPDKSYWSDCINSSGYIVDALLGTGLNRPVRGILSELIQAVNAAGKAVLSLDIPSGVQGETGQIEGNAVKADACVSFGNPKRGNILYPGFSKQGKIFCSHLSFPPEYYNHHKYRSELNLPPPLPERDQEGYKNSFGKILIIGGGKNYFGAVALAANAVFRGGGGYVTAAIPSSLSSSFSALCPEAVLEALSCTGDNSIHPENFEKLLKITENHDGVILGPGISRNPQTMDLVRQLIPAIRVPLLIDADGLHALAGHPELTASRKETTILTPHKGEQEVLLSDIKSATIENAYNAICVYKGPHSAIRTADGREYINLTGNSGLASAGSGDVLTGIIMGLIKSMPAEDAVRTGVLLHGLSAEQACIRLCEDSLNATDIIEYLPQAIRFYRKNHSILCKNAYNTINRLL